MDSPDSGEGTVAAVVNTVVFLIYMKGGEFFNHPKDYFYTGLCSTEIEEQLFVVIRPPQV
jgi:hypothetical protein